MWRFKVQGDIVSDYSRAYLLESLIRLLDTEKSLTLSAMYYAEKYETSKAEKVTALGEKISEVITEISDMLAKDKS